MTRAVFISAGGDPFILLTVVKLLKERCWNEFDSLYICYNNSCEIPKDVQSELLSRLIDDPKIKIVYWPTQIGYGRPITKMLQVCEEDLVLLLEDDGFIFTAGVIDSAFHQIEEGKVDAIGSPRFSCGFEISDALKRKYSLDYSGYGDVGPNYWPNFFFCKRSDLLATDLDFAPKAFEMGTYYKELDHKMSETQVADTFGWATMQMLDHGVKFGKIPQYHADPYEVEHKESNEQNWRDNEPQWIHGGSLSTSWGHYLTGAKIPDLTAEINMREFETRVAFWMICQTLTPGFNTFAQLYREGIANFVGANGLNNNRINEKLKLYKELMKL